MLFDQLKNDGIPSVKLNSIQQNACISYNQKLNEGVYKLLGLDCLVCGERDFIELGQKDRYGLAYRTVICNSCGLVQSDQRLESQSAEAFYRNEYPLIYFGEKIPQKSVFNNQYERANLIYRFIKPYLPEIRNYKNFQVFEVGCNTGGILKYFSDRGFRVSGLELNAEAVAYANTKGKLDVRQGSLSDINPGENPDLLIYSHVLEHLSNPEEELALIKSSMKDHSLLYLEMPGIKNIHQTYHGKISLYLQNAHVCHFSVSSLSNLLSKCGFEIIAADEYIRCLCRKSAHVHPKFINDRDDVMTYLSNLNTKQSQQHTNKFFQLSKAKAIFKRILKISGLYPLFFRWYHLRKI